MVAPPPSQPREHGFPAEAWDTISDAEKLVEMIREVSLTGDEASALDAIDASATPVLREAYRLIVAGGRSRHEPTRREGLADALKMKVQEHYNEWSDSGGGSVEVEEVEEVDFDADLARELEALMGEEEAPAPVEAAPAPPAGSPASQGASGAVSPGDLREKLRQLREERKRGTAAPKTMEEEMLEVMGLKKNPRRRPSAAQRQAWMRKYMALTGDPQPKPHDYWDGATYHFLSGKSPEEAAKLFMRKNTGRGRSARRRGGYRSNPALGGKARSTIVAYITRQGHGDVAEGVVEAVNTAVKDRDESPAEIAKLIMQHVPKLVEVYKRRAAEAVPEPAVAPPVVAPAGISAAEADAEIKRRIIAKIKEAQAAGQEIRPVGPQRAASSDVEDEVSYADPAAEARGMREREKRERERFKAAAAAAAADVEAAGAPSWIKPGARAFQTAHPEYGTWILRRDSHGQWSAKKKIGGSADAFWDQTRAVEQGTSISELVEFWEPGDAPAAPTQHPAPSPSAGTASSGKVEAKDLRAQLAEMRRKRAAKKNPRRRTRRY